MEPAAVRFCRQCGASMAPAAEVCTGCGFAYGKGERFCPTCGFEHAPAADVCIKCGSTLRRPAATFGGKLEQLPGNDIPEELLRRWNWGAFFLWVLWVFWNADTLHKVLAVVAYLFSYVTFGLPTFAFAIYLGARGNRLAAANRSFANVDQFIAVQRAWTRWGVGLFLASIVLGILGFIVWFVAYATFFGNAVHQPSNS
jgi:ribosomal protein L40E